MHLDQKSMRIWRATLDHTTSLWRKSASRAKLCSTLQTATLKGLHIKKIVCFGMGSLSLDPAFYESWVHHLAIFTMAAWLKHVYRETVDPDHPPIQVILQNPCYVGKNRVLLSERCPDPIKFMEDPDALLAVDAHTLVVTVFLAVGIPLMQIMADLFAKDVKSGPAAFICDIMDLKAGKKQYSNRDRGSPAVARFLLNEYDRKIDGFKDHVLEPELAKDTYWVGSGGKKR
jgi:hypothetical protein